MTYTIPYQATATAQGNIVVQDGTINTTSTSLALVGAGLKYYAAHSTTLAADKKPQTNTIGDYALYSGLGLAVLFHFIK